MTPAMANRADGPAIGPAAPPDHQAAKGTVVTGDEAMGELWQAHGVALQRFALKLTLGDRQRAEDIVQEALLRAWRHPEIVGSGQTPIRSWLFTVTRHVAIDAWRARSRTEAAEEIMDDCHADLPDPVPVIDQTVEALDVRAALAGLSAAHRQVITEMYLYGHSVAETARILSIPPGTVKSRSYYALRALRRTIPGPASGLCRAS